MYYNFQKDLAVGQTYEDYIAITFQRAGIPAEPNTSTDYATLKAFDLSLPSKNILLEVKFDAESVVYNNLCIECDLLFSAASYFIFGLPHKNGIYNHVFNKLELWKICMTYWNTPRHKFVGDGKRSEVICAPRYETTRRWGMSLQELIKIL